MSQIPNSPLPPPSTSRSCTDLICLILFFLFTLVLIMASIYASSTSSREISLINDCEEDKVCHSVKQVYKGVQIIANEWKSILVSIGAALAGSFVLLLFIRLTSTFLIYFLLAFTLFSLLFLAIYLILPLPSTFLFKHSPILSTSIGILLLILSIGLIVACCCFRKKIDLAGSVMKVAGSVTRENCAVLFLPIIITTFIVLYLCLWVEVVQGISNLILIYPFISPVLLFFHFLWSLTFIIHTSTFIITGTAINCYYSLPLPYSTASSNYIQFHAGSAIMGSCMTTLFGFPKFVYELFTDGEGGCCGGFCNKCCGWVCCFCSNFAFDCLNSSAYNFIHLTGESYCFSSLQALSLQVALPRPTSLLTLLLSIFSIALPTLISISSFILTYFLYYHGNENDNFNSPSTGHMALLMIVITFLNYCVARATIGVFGDSVNAIFICFMREIAHQQKKEGYCPQQLRQWMKQSTKQGHQQIID